MGLYGAQTFTRPNRNSIRTRRDSGEERKGKENMLQYPSFMLQYPYSTRIIPTSFLLPAQSPQPQSDELLLAVEESYFEEKCNEIRKMNSNLVVIGKTNIDNDKEDFDNEAEDDDADNGDESEGDDFEQETG
ncbi:uncharacterized protein LOC129896783 [Solanum dulcamara]|uniref:uncharacterized protein LOC129896783 n=1 Tax=Solanum dulcamara TaxID=45834 RepID=UPI0024852F6F|nr:uncharacterized protein LOC129896783 [Solanum dulcamara]